jgi:DNA-binding NarL/FixJ family response regulator
MSLSNHPPRVGLITKRGSLAARIRKALEDEDLALDFELRPDRLEGRTPENNASILVVGQAGGAHDRRHLRRIRELFPEHRIVLCPEGVGNPRPALEQEVDGIVPSDRLEESLGAAIRAVHAGLVAFPREALRGPREPDLTNREKQALSMVIMGLTNLEIAQKLFVSENTVKSHLNTAYKKLGVHSRAEAHRLITDPDRGLGTGILAITQPGLARGRPPRKAEE